MKIYDNTFLITAPDRTAQEIAHGDTVAAPGARRHQPRVVPNPRLTAPDFLAIVLAILRNPPERARSGL